MKTTPCVPMPLASYWREIRVRFLPGLVLAGSLVAMIFFWRQASPSAIFSGVVEGEVVNVSSPKGGVLGELPVSGLQSVEAGDVIGQVIIADPNVVQATLAVIHAEIQSLRASLGPSLPRERLGLGFDRLRLAHLEQQVELAAARTKLQLAESDLRRAERLFQEKIISQRDLEEAQSLCRRLGIELEKRLSFVAAEEENFHSQERNAAVTMDSSDGPSALQAAIRVQEAKLHLTEAEASPILLRAPLDGVIDAVHHSVGETVGPGEPIVTISAPLSKHILAYLRPPFSVAPAVGMKVQIRPRSFGRSVASATILRLGNRLETITPNLRLLGSSASVDLGLPVLVSVPETLKLLPGEIVDLAVVSPSGSVRPGSLAQR